MRKITFTIVTTLLLLLGAAGQAEAEARLAGTVVASGPDYLVLDTATQGRRLVVADPHAVSFPAEGTAVVVGYRLDAGANPVARWIETHALPGAASATAEPLPAPTPTVAAGGEEPGPAPSPVRSPVVALSLLAPLAGAGLVLWR